MFHKNNYQSSFKCERPLPEASLLSPKQGRLVHIYLEEPLWTIPRDNTMNILGLFVQLETVLRKKEERTSVTGRQVWFDLNQGGNALHLIIEALQTNGHPDLESYLRESGIGYLFPRVELYIQEPEQDLSTVASPIIDEYFATLTSFNNVRTLSQQIHTDLLTSASHKYIAHEIAVLYQCLNQVPRLTLYKEKIERKFTSIKSSCSEEKGGHPIRLPPQLHTWLVTLCQELTLVTECPPIPTDILAFIS